jgi:hypothetical protein
VDFAKVDNNLAKSQTAIGESSNLAQIALSYSGAFPDGKYTDYVCILSVVAQAAIDNAKRTFDCDIPNEIRRVKREMDLNTNGYPSFWRTIRPDFNRPQLINKQISCPMNYLNSYKDEQIRDTRETYSMDKFFINYSTIEPRRKSKRVEKLIQTYSLQLYKYNAEEDRENEEYFLLRQDFDDLVQDIRRTYISNNYLGLMSWLINRALSITDSVRNHSDQMRSTLSKNRALLFKVLYEVSPRQFLQCFAKNASKVYQ